MMKGIKLVALSFSLLTYISGATVTTAYGGSVDNKGLHDSTLRTMETLAEEYNLPSLSMAISIDEQIQFAQAVGFADVNLKKVADSQTQYSVGSIAKPMTGIALAKLLDAGKLALDSSIERYIADYPTQQENMTIKQLASHTAGIPHNTPERELREYTNVRDHNSPFEALDVFSAQPLLFTPGTGFKYSSNGYILLSAAIEKGANQDFVDYLRDNIWSEFGMSQTELDTSTAGALHEARYYSAKNDKGAFVPAIEKRDRSFLFGAGGFISTPTDLVKMSASLYREKYLSSQTLEAVLTPTKLANGDVNPQKYGLGWRVGEMQLAGMKDTVQVAHHGGVTDGAATAYLFVVPACKAAIAFATNTLPKQFWKLRPIMINLLKEYIRSDKCN